MCLPTKTLASACWRWGVALGLVGVSVVYSRPALGASISAIWANDGGDKVTQDELRVTQHKENLTGKVINRTWDGTTIHLYGARNEIVSFNLVLEAPTAKAANVSVSFDKLSDPNGAVIQNDTVASGNGVFSWVGRPIELFYVRYLKIDGLSYFAYVPGADKTVPIRFQQLNGSGWTGRPDHDKYYPDIMIPYELVKTFDIQASQNQSIWADVYIPKGLTPGVYTGSVVVKENGAVVYTVPVQLTVYNFDLPDEPSGKAAVPVNSTDIMTRWFGVNWVDAVSDNGLRLKTIRTRYSQLLHRHRITPLSNLDCNLQITAPKPCPESVAYLDGSAYSAANGYDGPGASIGDGVYSIGTYRSWPYWMASEDFMRAYSDGWVNWFEQYLPKVDYFLFLWDEPHKGDMQTVEQMASWVKNNPGPGHRLMTMSTTDMVLSSTTMPSLSIPASGIQYGYNDVRPYPAAAEALRGDPHRRLWMYNGGRPCIGGMGTEDDGVSLRETAWAAYKHRLQWYMYWDSSVEGWNNVFQTAFTWGKHTYFDPVLGMTGPGEPGNGNGVILYPGTDIHNVGDSYGLDGAFASMRMKGWRRGIQDVDYLTLAAKVDPAAVNALVQKVAPSTIWEVQNQSEGWNDVPISWPSDPDDWEAARAELAKIITGGDLRRQGALVHKSQ